MTEQDIEKRLRDVVKEPQPSAPQSLHLFLRELPESEAARHRGPLGHLRSALEGIPRVVVLNPNARRVQVAFGMAMAIVIGIAGAGVLLSLRQSPAAPMHNTTPGNSAPWVTPRRSTGTHQPPVQASLGIKNVVCNGVPVVENENMALPTAAVVTRSGTYLGVTGGVYGTTGLVHSDDGIYWGWDPPSSTLPNASVVTSIATDEQGTIVVTGGVQGVDGTTDGRIWTSSDDGKTWKANSNEASFKGVTVQAVAYSPGYWVALGWSNATAADAARQVAGWVSNDDGKTWNHIAPPIKGTSALLVSTAAGFVLSGTPLTTDAIDEPPIWYSTDGQSWTRAKAKDNTAQLMGPLTSATVTGMSNVYAVSTTTDGTAHQLVASKDGGMTWATVKPDDTMAYPGSIAHVASLSANDTVDGYVELVFATTSMGEGSYSHVMMSKDGGISWARLLDTNVGGPTGTMLLDLGHGWQAGTNRVLAFGDPGSGLGIWLIELLSSY
ncbi:MAG: sialidase family protein [Candidatus Limnocylindrales bacterium]